MALSWRDILSRTRVKKSCKRLFERVRITRSRRVDATQGRTFNKQFGTFDLQQTLRQCGSN